MKKSAEQKAEIENKKNNRDPLLLSKKPNLKSSQAGIRVIPETPPSDLSDLEIEAEDYKKPKMVNY